MFNHKCPFHVAVATSIVVGAVFYLSSIIYGQKKKTIERFDVDSRFTDSAKYGSLVFISGQVGEGETVEEQTVSALNYVGTLSDGCLQDNILNTNKLINH